MRSIDSKDAARLAASCSDKSAKHALATSCRTDSMHVTCGAHEQFPLLPAVRYIFRSTVERYCGCVRPGTLRKVCARALAAINEMLKSVYRCSPVSLRPLPPSWLFPACLLYTSPSPRDRQKSRMPSSA